jgi:hypothetical protein
LVNAVESQPPTTPSELVYLTLLTGRVIYYNNNSGIGSWVQTDSAYTQTYVPAGITNHNNLLGLQGGDTDADAYYHLTAQEYSGSGTGTILRSNSPAIIGNTSISGTFDVSGLTTLSGSFSVSGSSITYGTLQTIGTLTTSGALAVSGAIEIIGIPSASLIMNSADGSRWQIWIQNDGFFSSSKIT